jgi:hypothetical protein
MGIKFTHDRLTGMDYADLPDSILSLVRWADGRVSIGQPWKVGGSVTRVTNPEFDYAATTADFHRLAERFVQAATS